MYYRKSLAPGDATAWSAETVIDTNSTYPRLVVDAADNIYLFCRTGVSDCYELSSMYKSQDHGATWGSSHVFNLH